MNNYQLKRLHEMMQQSLDEIDRICNILNLRYYLIGGTLLGAVRHKGFIPWDDDLDVAMPREDYNTFLKNAPKMLNNSFWLQSRISDENYGNMFSKLIIKNTVFEQSINKNSNQNSGIFVDIFPLDHGQKDPNLIMRIRIYLARMITSYLYQKRNNIKLKILYLFKLLPDKILIRIEELLYKGKGQYFINYGSQYGINKQTINSKFYEPSSMLEFEGKEYRVPKDYKYILEKIYGKDYINLPPIEKRITHNPIRLSFDTTGPDELL